MNTALKLKPKQKGYVTNLELILFGLGTVLFPRVLITLKIPSIINFLHFVTIPLACGSVLFNSRSKDSKQIAISKSILLGLFLFLIVIMILAITYKVFTSN